MLFVFLLLAQLKISKVLNCNKQLHKYNNNNKAFINKTPENIQGGLQFKMPVKQKEKKEQKLTLNYKI